MVIIIVITVVVANLSELIDDAGLRRRLQGPAPVMVMGQASQHNYSAHMSTSLALGFLFMAGGAATFSTSPQATAALVIALFPRFPHSPTDHRCHLQVCASCSCCRANSNSENICSRAEVKGAVLACQEGNFPHCYSSNQAKLRVREILNLHAHTVQQWFCCKQSSLLCFGMDRQMAWAGRWRCFWILETHT